MAIEGKMRIHYIQHVHYEGIGAIQHWVDSKNHELTGTHLFLDERLPEIDDFDWLVIMGGPMSVHDESLYPWLTEEKQLIRQAINENRAIIGICLGAQLIADVLGADVRKANHKEIGWFSVNLTSDAENSELFKGFPETFYAFHWHGETFDIPHGAIHIAYSEAVKNQAFVYNNRVVGLQFHLETTRDLLAGMLENCRSDLTDGPFVQSESGIIAGKSHMQHMHSLLFRLLDNLEHLTFKNPGGDKR